jgi:hypothetical protein
VVICLSMLAAASSSGGSLGGRDSGRRAHDRSGPARPQNSTLPAWAARTNGQSFNVIELLTTKTVAEGESVLPMAALRRDRVKDDVLPRPLAKRMTRGLENLGWLPPELRFGSLEAISSRRILSLPDLQLDAYFVPTDRGYLVYGLSGPDTSPRFVRSLINDIYYPAIDFRDERGTHQLLIHGLIADDVAHVDLADGKSVVPAIRSENAFVLFVEQRAHWELGDLRFTTNDGRVEVLPLSDVQPE